jgi:MtN3 and saliva related transmembrane protein
LGVRPQIGVPTEEWPLDGKLITNLVGVTAAVFSVGSFVPQIVKMVQTKDVSGVSLRTYAFTVTCFTLWVIYGLRLAAWPIAASNACALMLSGAVLVLKWRYRGRTPAARASGGAGDSARVK